MKNNKRFELLDQMYKIQEQINAGIFHCKIAPSQVAKLMQKQIKLRRMFVKTLDTKK